MPTGNIRCVVKDCPTVVGSEVRIKRMFCFPKQRDICKKWVDYCQNPKVLEKFLNGSLPSLPHMRICSLHFTKEKFFHRYKTKLIRGAVPDILNTANIGSPDGTSVEVENVKEENVESPPSGSMETESSEGNAAGILAPVCSQHFPIVNSCEQCKAAMASESSSSCEESVNVNMQHCQASSLTLDSEADRTSLQNSIVQELESVLRFQWLEEKRPPHWRDLKKSIIELSVEKAIYRWCQEKEKE